MQEECAFDMLKYLMFRLGFRRQYRPDMVALQIQMYQLSRLLHDMYRDLYNHLENHDIAPTLYAAPWFLTMFASQFPLGFVARVFGEWRHLLCSCLSFGRLKGNSKFVSHQQMDIIFTGKIAALFPPDSHLKVGGADLSRGRLPPVINHSTLAYVCHYPGADCHQSSTIPPWSMCVTIQVQTATSHQPFHPGLCVSLSRCRLPPIINHSTLTYVCHYPGADCHQSSTIPPWPMCVTIQGQTATSHQPFHPDLCVSLSRGRLPPVINHSTLAYVCHYPGADCHQSSTIPPWPMCVTIQGQTATSHQPFHPGLCGSLSRCRLPPVINHSTLAYVCHYPGADCYQSSTIPPWPMCVTIQVQTATSHQPFHPGLCVSLSRGRLPPVINHSTLAYVCHYPGADCHQSSTIPPWPMCVTIQGQTATSHQPFHPGLCVSLSRGRLPPVINHSTLAYVCHYPGADCHQSSTIPFHVCHYPGPVSS